MYIGTENTLRCKHFLARKKRYCRMTVKDGEEFCGEHQPRQDISSLDVKVDSHARIACPLDPTHSCYANKLQKHLKKCNAKPGPPCPYIKKGCNCDGTESDNEATTKFSTLSDAPQELLLEVIAKVNKIYNDKIKDSVTNKILTHNVLKEELSKSENGNEARKHLLQVASIIGLLEEYELFTPKTCYIEFGAGRGKLSYWVTQTLEQSGNDSSSVLLVERASPRHKFENKLDKSSIEINRIRSDIADLYLAGNEIVAKSKNVVGLTKHLCGEATDLALRCLVNCQNSGKNVSGLLMTFCCHHQCQWLTYTGKKFLEEVGLTKSDMEIICRLVSWAVSGTSKSRKVHAECSDLDRNRCDTMQFSRAEKEEIGRKCKGIINWGRKCYLDEHNFDTRLHYYVDREISLENVCIVANKNML